jgi:diguanylate cyclase (GGDEF)-like protein/PAS domain S-box-containing protein
VWLAFLVAGTLITCVYLLLPFQGVQTLVFIVLGLCASTAIVFGTWMHRPAHPLVWHLLAGGLFMFVAGDIVYSYYEFVLDADPFPSLADVFYLGGYPFVAAGLLVLARARSNGGDRAAFLDAAILAIGLGVVSWVFLMAPYVEDPALSLLERSVAVAYPLADVLVLGILARFLAAPGARSTAYYLFGLSMVLMLICDIAYGVTDLAGTYESNSLIDAGYLFSYLLWGASALHPTMGALSEPAPGREAKLSHKHLVLLAGASLMAPTVLAVQAARGAPLDVPVVVGGSAVLLSLVLVRIGDLLRALTRSESRFRQLFENSVDALFVHDEEGRIVDCNAEACRSLGYPRKELLALSVKDFVTDRVFDEEGRREAKGEILWERILRSEPGKSMSYRQGEHQRKDGTTFPVEVVVGAIDYGGQRLILASARDVTERKALEDELKHQAYHDTLTGLPNKALFTNRLERALARAARSSSSVAILFTDLDNFKVINDSLGHQTGDRLLVAVAERLKTSVREGDIAARFGGDEFMILLEEVADVREATHAAERIVDTLREPFVVGENKLFVATSVGVVCGAYAQESPEDLLRSADLALYWAKRRGKNRYEVFDPEMNARAQERLELENDLRQALGRGELVVHYQPKVSLASGKIVGEEALVRWEHPQRGLVLPAEFVYVAEETGLIVPIGRWVLREACHQAREWQECYPSDPPLSMSVNLPVGQFGRPDLVEDVARVLLETGLEPSSLLLEITESAVMEDVSATIDMLRKLKDLGVRIAIDDFGTGHSSLLRLKHLPVDVLKIDRSFVAGFGRDPEHDGLVSAVIDLARALNLEVIAEGVETEEQLAHLREIGCEVVQGFYLAEPLPAAEASDLLAGCATGSERAI